MMAREWVIDLENEWKSTNSAREKEIEERRCIYRVPKYMRDFRSKCYAPQAVSLGPYHHGSEHLKGMEKFKRRILGCFLAKIDKTLDEAIMAMRASVQELMDAYDGLEEPWTNEDRFIQLMILDGCFLLNALYFQRELEDNEELIKCFGELSPWYRSIFPDTRLLENQVPLHALQILDDLAGEKVPTRDVARILLAVNDNVFNDYYRGINFKHYLHAVWEHRHRHGDFLFKSTFLRVANPPTVSELVEAGIEIKTSPTISFAKGILKIPQFTFNDDIEPFYVNLMAFETMHVLDPEFFSFLEFMNCLINTPDDVAILRKKGIFDGGTQSDGEVSVFFDNITKGICRSYRRQRMDGEDVAKLLVDYRRKWQNRWVASFKHLYLANPWAFISLLAAILLLALTILSTVYAVLQYYHS